MTMLVQQLHPIHSLSTYTMILSTKVFQAFQVFFLTLLNKCSTKITHLTNYYQQFLLKH